MTSDEAGRLRLLASSLTRHGRSTAVAAAGIDTKVGPREQDDCAVIACRGDFDLVVGSDYIRGTGFRLFELGHLTYFDLGYFLATANLSDIAAMGAEPVGLLSVVRYPADLDDSDFESIIAGIDAAARTCGTEVLGGDIGGAASLVLSATALGAVEPGCALLRKGASAGDIVYVSGEVGRAGAAVVHFSQMRDKVADPNEAALLQAWKRPVARIREGRLLVQGRYATACQDVSDGLAASLYELAARSQVGFAIDLAAVPVAEAVQRVAAAQGVSGVGLAMSASTDFELVFTVPPNLSDQMESAFAAEGFHCTAVGVATGEPNLVEGVDQNGSYPIPGIPWRHQPGDIARTVLDGLKAPASNEPKIV